MENFIFCHSSHCPKVVHINERSLYNSIKFFIGDFVQNNSEKQLRYESSTLFIFML